MANPLRRSLTLALLSTTLVMAACAPADESAGATAGEAGIKAGAYEPKVGKPGGTISYVTFSEPKTFNYGLAAESSSTDILNRCFMGLVVMDGVTTEDKPELAEKWELQPDKKSYVFTLRENLKWSDGKPLTADDVLFSFKDVAMNYPSIPSNLHDSLMIDGKYISVEKLDDRRIKFSAPKPFGPFVTTVGAIPILPRHVLGEAVQQKDSGGNVKFNSLWGVDADPKSIVTNGPFMIGEYLPGQRTVLVRNPHYWQKDSQGQALPYVEKYVWYSVKDYPAMLMKFKAKEVDVNEPMRPADYEIMKPKEKEGNFTIHEGGPDASSAYLTFNMTTATKADGKPYLDPIKAKWFRNLHFRKAVQYAVDRPTIIKSVFRGLGSPCYSATIVQSTPFHTTDIERYDYSLEKAAEELKAGGFTKNAQGQLLDAEGHPVHFTLQTNTGNTNRDAICNIMRTDWAKLGMKVDYRPIEFNVLVGKMHDSLDFDVVLMGLNLVGSPDPHLGMNVWLLDGKMHTFNHGKNTTYEPWEKEILAVYEKAAVTTDRAERIKLYHEALKLEAKYLPFVYTVTPNFLCGVRNDIGNVHPTAIGRSFWNIPAQFRDSAV